MTYQDAVKTAISYILSSESTRSGVISHDALDFTPVTDISSHAEDSVYAIVEPDVYGHNEELGYWLIS
jgi:hypothetical protein